MEGYVSSRPTGLDDLRNFTDRRHHFFACGVVRILAERTRRQTPQLSHAGQSSRFCLGRPFAGMPSTKPAGVPVRLALYATEGADNCRMADSFNALRAVKSAPLSGGGRQPYEFD